MDPKKAVDRQRWRGALFAAAVIAIVGIMTGCGGSSSTGAVVPTPTPTPTPTRPAAPAISAQPVDQTVVAPAAANFSVTASVDGVTYQWQWSIDGGATWSDIAGAANASYAFAATNTGMNGLRLRAVASNIGGAVTSSAASLSVRPQGAPAATLDLLAGSIGGPGTVDGAGTSARFRGPVSVSIDGAGTQYVWDGFIYTASGAPSACIRKISSEGFTSTFALPGAELADCISDIGRLIGNSNVDRLTAIDVAGNLYFSLGDGTVRKLSAAGVLTTLAGTPGTSGSADGTGAAARFGYASWTSGGVAVDAAGNVFMADTDNSTIRKITPAGVVTTLAGSPGVRGSADGTGAAALFFFPYAVAVDASGNVFVADQWNHTIRKITSAGVVTTFAGLAGRWGSADGTGSAARFAAPSGLAIDGDGNVYVADRDNAAIRKITPAGEVSTVAGAAAQPGAVDGTGGAARFNGPRSVAVDAAGNLFVADTGNAAIRKITPQGVVRTWAGAPLTEGSADGDGAAAGFRGPVGVAAGSNGNIFVADSANHTIRQITSSGLVTTLAGFALNPGSTDATGQVARFNKPSDIAVEASGSLLVTDAGNASVRAVTPSGQATTRLSGREGPTGIASAAGGGFYLGRNLEYASGIPFSFAIPYSVFERIDAAGNVIALAGTTAFGFGLGSFRDGAGDQALFARSGAIVVDAAGVLYVADTGNCVIRRIGPTGIVSTLAGRPPDSNGIWCGSADGVGDAARFRVPEGLTLDGIGNLYVADTGNHTIRKIAPDGTVTTVLGVPGEFGISVGGNPSLTAPQRIAWLGGNRFVITSGNAVLIAILP